MLRLAYEANCSWKDGRRTEVTDEIGGEIGDLVDDY